MPLLSQRLENAKQYLRDVEARGGSGDILSIRFRTNRFPEHFKAAHTFYGYAVATHVNYQPTLVVLTEELSLDNYEGARFITEHHQAVAAWYVAGWNVTGRFIVLKPITDGSHMLPPGVCYHAVMETLTL